MPRDGAGNYTLPAGNPVVSGEVITPTWANPTMDDVAIELTDSLSRSGKGSMLVPFSFSDGSISAPGIGFGNEPTSGLYREATNDLRMSVGATDKTRWIAGNFGFEIWSGSAWVKPIVPSADVTVTGNWTFNNLIIGKTNQNLTFDFDGVITGDWDYIGITPRIGGVNIATLNDISAPPALDDYTRTNQAETITSTWTFDQPILGSCNGNLVSSDLDDFTNINVQEVIVQNWTFPTATIIKDGIFVDRRIAYRDPPEILITPGDATEQLQEGNILRWESGAGNFNVGVLFKHTNITIKHRGDVGTLMTLVENSVTLIWMDGEGVPPLTGNRTLTSNSVVQLVWEETNVVTIWGNGLA